MKLDIIGQKCCRWKYDIIGQNAAGGNMKLILGMLQEEI
jgi:hypothetical protein